MLPRCLKLLLLLIYIQSTVAQLPNLLGNGGYQNLPVPDVNQPVGSNLPATCNIPSMNTRLNGNALVNGLSKMPKLSFINGQINELINIANNINKRQIAGNNPSASVQNAPINKKFQMINNNGSPTLVTNTPCLPANNLYSNGNNLVNNIPNNINIPANTAPYNNLPCYNNPLNSNVLQYKLPENNNIGFSNLPINKLPKINSLTLAGEAFNNGLPFSVLPAHGALNNVNEIPNKNFLNYNDGPNNGPKIIRSLPANDVNDSGYPVADNIIENNSISPWKSYANEVQGANMPQNNIIRNEIPLNNGLQANNGMPLTNGLPLNNGLSFSTTDASTFNVPAVIPFNNDYTTNTPFNNGEPLNSFAINNFNNILPNNEQIVSNNYRIPLYTEWQQPFNPIFNQNNELMMANLPANNLAYSQPTSNSFNLPDLGNINTLNTGELSKLQNNELLLANLQSSNVAYQPTGKPGNSLNLPGVAYINMLNTGELGNLQNNKLLVANLPASNVAYAQPTGNNFNLPDLANMNMLNVGELGNLQNNELLVANFPASNVAYSQLTGNNLNLPDLSNVNLLNFGELGNFPIFNGLPVLDITETVTVINPGQFNQI